MTTLYAKDIMHPRVSLFEKESGDEVVTKLMSGYSALPVVNDNLDVTGIVSEYDILLALKEGRTIHEFSAESIMTCGHVEHSGVCDEPITVSKDTPLDEIVEIFYTKKMSMLPVVDGKKLIGLIGRKNIINAAAEKGFWPEHEFQLR